MNGAPTASIINLGTWSAVNATNSDYICYAWAEVDGYSKFGIYSGNSTTSTPKNGPFVYLGFRPAFLLIKSTSGPGGGSADQGGWHMYDDERSTYNPSKKELFADSASSEGDPGNERIDFTANGFKIRDQYDLNGSGRDYIYAAFSRNPLGGSGVAQAKAI